MALVARRTPEVQLWALANQIGPSACRIYGADVSVADSIVEAGQACIAQQGLPDVVIANAGVSIGMGTGMLEDLDVMRQTFAVNNIGMAATFHPFVEAMSRRGSGVLVGIGSIAGIRGLPGYGAYCASKAAVIAYCESLRGELEAFAEKAFAVIEAGKSYCVIPWQMGIVAKMLRILPNALFDRALTGRPRKARQKPPGI